MDIAGAGARARRRSRSTHRAATPVKTEAGADTGADVDLRLSPAPGETAPPPGTAGRPAHRRRTPTPLRTDPGRITLPPVGHPTTAPPRPDEDHPAAAGPGSHRPELDGLRAMAVAVVWVHHAALAAPALSEYTMPEAIQLSGGVELFFVLSGFLIYGPFARAHVTGSAVPAARDYARRRIMRIYPAYLVAFITLWALGWIQTEGLGRFVANLTLTQDYQASRLAVDGIEPAWTLCVEMSFYAAVPLWAALVRWAGRGRDPVRAELAGAAALMVMGVVALWLDVQDLLPWPLRVLFTQLPTLAGGMLLAVVAVSRADRPRLDHLARRVPPAVVCWPLGIWILMAVPQWPTGHVTTTTLVAMGLSQAAFGLLLAVPILLGVAPRGRVTAALRSRPFVGVGLVSYGIYLWHYDVLDDAPVGHLDHTRLVAVATLALLLAVAVGLAIASHRLVEQPALAWARSRERTGRRQRRR